MPIAPIKWLLAFKSSWKVLKPMPNGHQRLFPVNMNGNQCSFVRYFQKLLSACEIRKIRQAVATLKSR